MTFPSISRIYNDFKNVIGTYPFEVFSAFAGSCAATVFIELENNDSVISSWCVSVMMAANISLLLSLSASLFSKSRNLSSRTKLLISTLAFLTGAGFTFVFDPLKRESDYIRFSLLSFSLHLLVAFAAFIRKEQINAFWQFNKTIFLRILVSVLYSGVLYIGLAAAVSAMNFLFNFNFEGDTFGIMAVWIFGMFQTLFFLSGIPELNALEDDLTYPKGLKLFTQYVLIPLATVYVVILISYELKILIQWNMPKGLVSSLILGYAVFGILSYLLIYPLRNQEEHKWIKTYSKSFFYLLIPLLALLYLAIFVRVEKYGITEQRYFLVSLAVWLSFIAFYFISFRRQNIVIVPLSLCLITLLAVYGPLSAFNIAEYSQFGRLNKLLIKNKLLTGGKLRPVTATLDSADTDNIIETSRYLVQHYGIESLQDLIKEDLTKVSDSIKSSLQKDHRGRGTYSRWDLNEQQRKWLFAHYKLPLHYREFDHYEFKKVGASNADLVPLHGADFMIDISFFQDADDKINIGPHTYLSYTFSGDTLLTLKIAKDSLNIDFVPILKRVDAKVSDINKAKNIKSGNSAPDIADNDEGIIELPRELLMEHFKFKGYDFTILINQMDYQISAKEHKVESVNGVLLLKKLSSRE